MLSFLGPDGNNALLSWKSGFCSNLLIPDAPECDLLDPAECSCISAPFFFFLRFTFRNNKVLLHGQIIRIIANMFFRGRFTVSSIDLISLSLSCVYAIKKTSIKNKIIIVWIAKPTFYALSGRPVWKRLCHRFRRFSLYPNARQHVV